MNHGCHPHSTKVIGTRGKISQYLPGQRRQAGALKPPGCRGWEMAGTTGLEPAASAVTVAPKCEWFGSTARCGSKSQPMLTRQLKQQAVSRGSRDKHRRHSKRRVARQGQRSHRDGPARCRDPHKVSVGTIQEMLNILRVVASMQAYRSRTGQRMVVMLLGCGLRRSELMSVTVKTIRQRQAPLSGSPAKRISEKKL